MLFSSLSICINLAQIIINLKQVYLINAAWSHVCLERL